MTILLKEYTLEAEGLTSSYKLPVHNYAKETTVSTQWTQPTQILKSRLLQYIHYAIIIAV